MKLSDLCFLSAALAALLGIALGIYMGLARDLTLAPAHAHLNLLGWVTMALIGLYYRGSEASSWRLARLQVGLGAFGFWVMPLGLGAYLASGDDRWVPLVVLASFAALAAMALFLAVLVLDLRGRTSMRYRGLAESG